MKVSTILCALALVSVVGCSATQPTPPTPNPTPPPAPVVNPILQTGINIGVSELVGLGCKMIPASDKALALTGLSAVSAALVQGPAQALKALEDLAQNPSVAFIWSGLHSIIDKLNGITGALWFAYVQGAIGSAVTGCRGGLGG